MIDAKSLCADYLAHLQFEKCYSVQTVSAYRRDIEALLTLANDTPIDKLQTLDIRRFAATLHSRGLSGRSIGRMLSAWRSWYRWMLARRLVSANPVTGVKAPKYAKGLPAVYSPDEMSKLLDGTGNDRVNWQTALSVQPDTESTFTASAPQKNSYPHYSDKKHASENAPDRPEPLLIRDLAIAELFYSTGLRLSELASLNISSVGAPTTASNTVSTEQTELQAVDTDEPSTHYSEYKQKGSDKTKNVIDLDNDQLTVMGKGGKMRLAFIGKQAKEAILAYLPIRNRWANAGETALFVSRRGSRMTVRSIQLRLLALSQRRNLDSPLHPHMLRHSFASHVLQSSGDLRAVQELLGHSSIASTQVYTHLDFQALAKVYDETHPRAKKNIHKEK